MSKIKIGISFFIIVSLLTISGCGCKQQTGASYRVKLEVWGPLDDSYTYSEIFKNYQEANPQIAEIEYKKYTVDTYKKDLIEALASGQGPDIFLIHNTWLPNFQDKVVPAPAEILNEQRFRQQFVDVAASDFINNGSIWAVPLSVDSLGLYYNKDLFNSAGITAPPKTWDEFTSDVMKLTKVDGNGEIIQSGAALGTAYNINRSTDVLSLLMLQNGTQMIDENGNMSMDSSQYVNGQLVSSAENALNFYTQFAKSSSSVYSWNPTMHYSIDAFAEGKVAMMLNYSWHLATISDKSPKLNFAVAPVPQFPGTQPVNYANYWAFAVARNKVMKDLSSGQDDSSQVAVDDQTRITETWKFLNYLTTQPEVQTVGVQPYDPAREYIVNTQQPSARRDIIEEQKTDPQLGVFALGNLAARSWRQVDPESNEAILAEMIDQVNRGYSSVSDAIKRASQRMEVLIQNKN